MPHLDPSCLRAYLRSTGTRDWLSWSDHLPDLGLAAEIRAALYGSGSVLRDVQVIRASLFELALREAHFRQFLEDEATPDTITAGFLEEQLDAE